jgi:hypothetical protein
VTLPNGSACDAAGGPMLAKAVGAVPVGGQPGITTFASLTCSTSSAEARPALRWPSAEVS